MKSVIFLEKILIDPPRTKIYQRLGFKKRTTQIPVNRQKETDRFIDEAVSIISLQGSLLRIPIRKNNGEEITFPGNFNFNSKKLSAFLFNCAEAVLMGATAGNAIMEAIEEKTNHDNLSAAVVYDATASEIVDAGLDWIMSYLNQQVRRQGKTLLPRRFSAGYADFHLKNQKMIYDKLQMQKIGVAITPGFILIPEKSVTAISGIR